MSFRPKLLAILLFAVLTNLTCKKSPLSPDGANKVEIRFEDASCTEAWFNLKFYDLQLPVRVEFYKDNFLDKSFNVFSSMDTLVYIENLLPKRRYEVHIKVKPTGGKEVESDRINFETMDTTSHEFSWEITYLGDGGGSVLYDIAIINDTLAYAVGEIYKRDSLGNWDPNAYNLVKWDGSEWKLKRIYTYSSCNPVDYAPLKAIWAFSDSNIVVTSGGSIGWFNGKTNKPDCSIRPLLTGSINKIWGTSNNDLYVVGNNDNIAHYSNGKWRRLESGTELDVYDIFGSHNPISGKTELLAVAAKQFVSFEKRILKITPTGVSTVSDNGISYSIHGIWFRGGGPYYVVGSGIYRKLNIGTQSPWQSLHSGLTPFYIYAVRGNDINDIVVCGSFGELIHFNGVSWRSFQRIPGFSNTELYEIAIYNNLVVAVGYAQTRAVAIIGRRK